MKTTSQTTGEEKKSCPTCGVKGILGVCGSESFTLLGDLCKHAYLHCETCKKDSSHVIQVKHSFS